MTFETMCNDFCQSNGMSDTEANQVVEKLKNSDLITDSMRQSFNSPVEDYPPSVQALVMMALKPVATEWIEENIPRAWFKPLFQ